MDWVPAGGDRASRGRRNDGGGGITSRPSEQPSACDPPTRHSCTPAVTAGVAANGRAADTRWGTGNLPRRTVVDYGHDVGLVTLMIEALTAASPDVHAEIRPPKPPTHSPPGSAASLFANNAEQRILVSRFRAYRAARLEPMYITYSSMFAQATSHATADICFPKGHGLSRPDA